MLLLYDPIFGVSLTSLALKETRLMNAVAIFIIAVVMAVPYNCIQYSHPVRIKPTRMKALII